ncbi:MAG: flagellar filament capping protein FliD [Selenomonadaceae bacterium]|nr:flagellar filament capping protein FliD [Selenomonadaceae bacterium]
MAINSIGNGAFGNNFLFNTATNNKKQDSISQLWSAYGSYQNNAAQALSGLTEIGTNVRSLLASYDDAKSAFNSEFGENMDALSKSAANVKKYNFSLEDKAGAITTNTSTDEDGVTTTTTTYSKELQSAIDAVKGLVDDYNGAVKFLNDNGEVSKRVDKLAQSFGDTTYRSSLYESVGLTTKSDGSFEIDEEKLANAIVNDPDKVSRILGKDGLAGKAESHVSFANSQKDSLFPTAQKMFGNQLTTAQIYTGSAFRNMTSMNNVGNLLNMMF